MNLQDFIKETLIQIARGIEGAAAELKDSKAIRTTSHENVPKKADTLNADLAASGVYGKLDQKNVTAWLDLRNKAAHGHYKEYTKEQVTLLLNAVRDFVTRLPA